MQTPVLRMLVDRHKERAAFVPVSVSLVCLFSFFSLLFLFFFSLFFFFPLTRKSIFTALSVVVICGWGERKMSPAFSLSFFFSSLCFFFPFLFFFSPFVLLIPFYHPFPNIPAFYKKNAYFFFPSSFLVLTLIVSVLLFIIFLKLTTIMKNHHLKGAK